MDVFKPAKRSEIMRKIGGKNTAPELALRKALFAEGMRYRLHSKNIPGKPDIVFKKCKLVIFVDGEWWHGKYYETEVGRYPKFWQVKIKRNMDRDRVINKKLKDEGWGVLRFWAKDVVKDPHAFAMKIKSELTQNLRKLS